MDYLCKLEVYCAMKVCKYNTRESSPLPQLEYTYITFTTPLPVAKTLTITFINNYVSITREWKFVFSCPNKNIHLIHLIEHASKQKNMA